MKFNGSLKMDFKDTPILNIVIMNYKNIIYKYL